MAFRQLEPRKTVYSVGDFVEWGAADSLDLTPSFQRRTVWKKPAKSFLIDTILRGLPIPIIFLREVTEVSKLRTIRQVVDGQQRIHTLFSYIKPEIIKNFDEDKDSFVIMRSHNRDLSGMSFHDLDQELRHRILNYQFSVHVLPADTSDRDVLEIFRRMNSTGTVLNAQELRNAEYSGAFATSVANSALQQLDRWRSWGIFNEDQIARMNEVELTADIFILIMSGIVGRTKATVDGYYERFEEEFAYENIVERRFQAVFDEMNKQLGKQIHKMEIVRRTLFYGNFAAFYDFMYGIDSDLKNVKPKRLPPNFGIAVQEVDKRISSSRAPARVVEALARRTTHVSSRKIFIEFLVKNIQNAVSKG